MLNLAKTSKLSPEEILNKAKEFFGPGGYGLAVTEEATGYVAFEGGGGGIEVIVNPDGKKTSLELTSREWDIQAKEFITKIS